MPSMEVRFMMSLRHWKASHEILLCCSLYGKTSFTWNTLVLFFIWQDKLHMKYSCVVLYMARQASHEIPFCCSLYGKTSFTWNTLLLFFIWQEKRYCKKTQCPVVDPSYMFASFWGADVHLSLSLPGSGGW